MTQDEQTVESFRLSDGICFYGRNDKEEKTLFAIAIASNALQHGLSYLHFLLLHELTHALVQGVQEKGPGSLPHDELFEAQLNELIDEFNRQMGADLSNDYSQYGDY